MNIPTLLEVVNFCDKNRLAVCPQSFYEYYTDLDWMVGSRPMSSWKYTLRNWDRKERRRLFDCFDIDNLCLPTFVEFTCFIKTNFLSVDNCEISDCFKTYSLERFWEHFPDWRDYVEYVADELSWC